mmetsp:Transcript_7749/g.10048  ORF Transcript_7749/g.10048 Transcript_7749/m.10048 type:complete len:258 (-) Transcript_7749:57-830(-)
MLPLLLLEFLGLLLCQQKSRFIGLLSAILLLQLDTHLKSKLSFSVLRLLSQHLAEVHPLSWLDVFDINGNFTKEIVLGDPVKVKDLEQNLRIGGIGCEAESISRPHRIEVVPYNPRLQLLFPDRHNNERVRGIPKHLRQPTLRICQVMGREHLHSEDLAGPRFSRGFGCAQLQLQLLAKLLAGAQRPFHAKTLLLLQSDLEFDLAVPVSKALLTGKPLADINSADVDLHLAKHVIKSQPIAIENLQPQGIVSISQGE